MVLNESKLTRDTMIALAGVDVAFADKTVLRDIHLTLRHGESMLVVGPSGCGKSTLAMLIAQIIPQSIEAEVTGERWYHPNMAQPGRVGYVFQDPDSQFCQIRAGEEVAFGLENLAVPSDGMEPLIDEALQSVHLRIRPEVEHNTLSGGNKQRLALASALVLDPDLVILDEPTANLDPRATADVFSEIAKLQALGKTLLVIEHKFLDLVSIIPTMVLMSRQGDIYRVGPSQELMVQEAEWMRQEGLIVDRRVAMSAKGLLISKPLVELENVAVRYTRHGPDALSGINLRCFPGELVALVGSNGAGKSTLLKLIAGLKRHHQGRAIHPAVSEVAFGFQNPEHQFIFERVVDEMSNRYVEGVMPEDTRQQLEQFGLLDHARLSPYSLSQGQKRRLSVACMLQKPHSLYCLDEPTFGQDASTRDVIMERLQERQRAGALVIISTHDLDLVAEYATRVIAMDQGEVVFDGEPSELLTNDTVLDQCHLVAHSGLREPQDEPGSSSPQFMTMGSRVKKSTMGRINPVWKLLGVFLAVGLTAFAHTLPQAMTLAAIPLVLLVTLSGISLLSVIKRLLPFVLFFALYTWMMTAYAAVGPQTPVFHLLWYRLSYPGFIKGLILGFRMLSAVSFGLLFVSTVDLVDLVKGLSRIWHIPPKFSYGTLAGLRFFPSFIEEWDKLRLARRVRGRDLHWSPARIVTYALPLLSDAVRLSERVAIAMEARGFKGEPMQVSTARSYYHPIASSWRDAVFVILLLFVTVLALWH